VYDSSGCCIGFKTVLLAAVSGTPVRFGNSKGNSKGIVE
jgi:hypothetical protein